MGDTPQDWAPRVSWDWGAVADKGRAQCKPWKKTLLRGEPPKVRDPLNPPMMAHTLCPGFRRKGRASAGILCLMTGCSHCQQGWCPPWRSLERTTWQACGSPSQVCLSQMGRALPGADLRRGFVFFLFLPFL